MLLPTNYAGSQRFRIIYQSFVLVAKIILPVVITLVATTMLVMFLQKRNHFRKALDSESDVTGVSSDKLHDLTICLVALAVCFFLLLPPVAVTSALVHTNISDCAYLRAIRHVVSLAQTNSCINFFIYYWKLSSFRTAVKELFCCHTKQKQKIPKPAIFTCN